MTRADTVIVLAALALIGWLYGVLWVPPGEYPMVEIRDAAGITQRVPLLDGDRRVSVQGPLGQSVIEIRDGSVRFSSSPCPQKLCIHSSWQKQAGEAVACLPNRVSLLVTGGEVVYDAINF